jgi:hypothetical protein
VGKCLALHLVLLHFVAAVQLLSNVSARTQAASTCDAGSQSYTVPEGPCYRCAPCVPLPVVSESAWCWFSRKPVCAPIVTAMLGVQVIHNMLGVQVIHNMLGVQVIHNMQSFMLIMQALARAPA